MPRIRWARRLADGTEQHGIECVCGGDLLATDEHGVWRCQRCGSELRLGQPIPTDPLTGERAASTAEATTAWSVWLDEQRYKRSISKTGNRSTKSRNRRKERPLEGVARERARIWRRIAQASRRMRQERRGLTNKPAS